MPPRHVTTCQNRRTARLTTDHRERRTATTTPRPQMDGHADGHATGTARHDHARTCSRHTERAQAREAQAQTYDRTYAHEYHTTRHTSTHTPHGRGYPRIKNRAAGPLVLTLNASQTIFELRVTHEIFTRVGHATVVAPAGVSRIHLG